jgi:hypothetical protein
MVLRPDLPARGSRLDLRLRTLYGWMQSFGLDPFLFWSATRRITPVFIEYATLRKQNRQRGFNWKLSFSRPNLHDRNAPSGDTKSHYFLQDLVVAQRVFARNPERHIDVGSRIDGFVAHVASFRKIEVLDIRPLETSVSNISFTQCDLMVGSADLVNVADSVSCLHAIEHMGLGRYGDSLDIGGHVSAFEGLTRIVKPGGTLYLSVPIGAERIEFNGHRVFAIDTILQMSRQSYRLADFTFIDDSGVLHERADIDSPDARNNFGLRYGCGIFELTKL